MNFQFNLRKIAFALFLIGLPLISINMQRNPGEPSWYMLPFNWTFSALHSSYSKFNHSVRSTTGLYLNLWDIKKNNRILKKKADELNARQAAFTELQLENQRLRQLLKFQKQSKMELVAAQIIGHDLMGDRDTIQLNRGQIHGVKAGQAVISTEGAVGYILQPNKFTSQVLVLTDRYAVMDAVVQRSRVRVIVEGTNEGVCQLKHLERADDVKIGDLVVTSGFGKLFPKGFPIGLVTQVKRSQYGVSQEVILKSVVHPKRLEEVFIIKDAASEIYEGPSLVSTSAPSNTTKGEKQ